MKTHSSKKHLAFTAMLAAIVVAGHAQNVGIGTSTPTARLHVAGTLRVDQSSLFGARVGIGTGNGELNALLTVEGAPSRLTETELLAVFRSSNLSSSTDAVVRVENPNRNNAAVVGTDINGAFIGAAAASRFDIRMGNEVRMIFDASGSVGIGTGGDKLNAVLTVKGKTGLTTGPETLADFRSDRLINFLNSQIVVQNPDPRNAAIMGTNMEGAFVGVATARRFDIRLGDNASMVFDPNGRVGIGTGTPTARLHVAGTLRVDESSVFGARVGIGTGNDELNALLTVKGAPKDLTETELLAVFRSSNISLFTDAVVRVENPNRNNAAVVGTDINGAFIGAAGASRFDIRLGNEVRMIFDASGRVGIGTNNIAGGQLDVNGSLALRSASIQIAAIQTTIAAGNRSFLRLANGLGGPTFITMEPGSTDGQVLIILAEVTAPNSSVVFLDNGNNRTQLNADYQMGTDDTLTLVWSEQRQRWIELSRSVN